VRRREPSHVVEGTANEIERIHTRPQIKEVAGRSNNTPSDAENASGERADRKGERKARRRRNASVGPAPQETGACDRPLTPMWTDYLSWPAELGTVALPPRADELAGSEVKALAEEGARVTHAQDSVACQ
jgi:hypothetical protein